MDEEKTQNAPGQQPTEPSSPQMTTDDPANQVPPATDQTISPVQVPDNQKPKGAPTPQPASAAPPALSVTEAPQPSAKQPVNQASSGIDLTSSKLSQEPKGKPSVKLLVIFLIFLLFSISTGGIALAYNNYQIFSPSKLVRDLADWLIISTPLPNTPRVILEKATKEMAGVKTAVISLGIDFSAKGSFPIKNANFTITGPVDFKSEDQSRSQADIRGQIALEGLSVSAAGSIRQIDDKLYFKITEIPGGSFYSLQAIKDQWFVLTIDELSKTPKDQNSKLQTQKIKTIVEDFITSAYTFTDLADSDNKDIFRLKAAPSKEKVSDLLYQIIDVLEPKPESELEKNLARSNLEKYLENMDKIEIILDVNKKNFLIDSIELSLFANIETPKGFFETGKVELPIATTVPITIKLSAKFSDYNKLVLIEIPQDAKELDSYLDNLKNLAPQENLPELQQPTPPDDSQGSLRQLLDDSSPVLGQKNKYWDIAILDSLRQVLGK